MKSIKKALIYGVLIWIIPFAVSFIIFSLHDDNRALFESIMAVVVTAVTMAFGICYLKKVEGDFLKEGIWLGIIWLVTSLVIDLILFLPESDMHMDFVEYIYDIGITYLIIPIVTIGLASLLKKTKRNA
ncbi:hypothetical protein KKG41_04010 [Patescibacteria group bacterium]|nr:hypothetical protein [Patescibacteria group bacterium]MBU1891041.1 hypothetical protein [Patescibacteria group bacterium]